MIKAGAIKQDHKIIGYRTPVYDFHKSQLIAQNETKSRQRILREQTEYYLEVWQRWALTDSGYRHSSLANLAVIKNKSESMIPTGVEMPTIASKVMVALESLNNGTEAQKGYSRLLRAFYLNQAHNESIEETLRQLPIKASYRRLRRAKEALGAILFGCQQMSTF